MSLSKSVSSLNTILAGATLLISSIAAAGPVNAQFNADVSVAEQLVPTPNTECTFRGLTAGIGTASYLGNVVLGANDCVNPLGSTPASGFQFTNGGLVFTAANGDMLFASYSGKLVPAPKSIDFNPFTIADGMYSITGGTGRFVGATGKGVLTGMETLNFLTLQAVGTLHAIGTISLPADNQQGRRGQQGQQGQQGRQN